MEMTEFTIRITPFTEEILKAIPVLFFAREISNKRESIITISLAVGIGFAVMENSFVLLRSIDSVSILWAVMRGFGTGMMHGMCTFLVGSGFSFINKNKKLFIVGTFSLMSLAITYHSVFNMLVQSEFYYFGALLPIVTFIPFAIARFKLAKEVKKNETV
jgi:RsiW-degrading membrane proteinase PrsW (M82 family)